MAPENPPPQSATPPTPLRVLVVEDSMFDTQILAAVLKKGHFHPAILRVETAEQMKAALADKPWDLVIADYNLPQFSAPAALEILHQSGLDLPFIIVSGAIGEHTAIEAMRAGAHDYLMKGNLNRLVPAVLRELREAANRESKRNTHQALRESELRYRLLWETATDAIILMNSSSQILFANPAVRDLFGYEPDELVGQNLAILQPERLRQAHRAGLERYLATGQKRLNWRATETVALHKSGREFPVEVAFSFMTLEDQKLFVGFIRDVTERQRTQNELRQNQEQLQVAREIQQRLFPKSAPQIEGFDIAGASLPAEATGGDYYDFFPSVRHGYAILIGDVTGHGLGPALLMAETRAYLRLLARNREHPGEILKRANSILAEDVGYERFVTLLFLRLDLAQRTLSYANAGHPTGFILGREGKVRAELKRTGPPLGFQPQSDYPTAGPVPLQPGDVLVLVTDGFEESLAEDDEAFGIQRTLDVIRQHQTLPAQEIVDALYRAVTAFSRGTPQLDDLTVIIIKVLDPS